MPLTRAVSDAVRVPVIASGGVGTLDHLTEGVVQGGASAVLAASIFHFGTYTVPQAKAALAAQGLMSTLKITFWTPCLIPLATGMNSF